MKAVIMKMTFIPSILLLCLTAIPSMAGPSNLPKKPEIVVILADDLGYGDVQCNHPEPGKISTPYIDKLAARGMRFTDGHSSSGGCTPSRYSVLTGRYHWRTPCQRSVLSGRSKPLIAPGRLTLASLVKADGYDTACVGKWHLGMMMPRPITEGSIKAGPTTHGFDCHFGISASLDMAPCAFIENDRFTDSPKGVPQNANSLPQQQDMRGYAHPAACIPSDSAMYCGDLERTHGTANVVSNHEHHENHQFLRSNTLPGPRSPLLPRGGHSQCGHRLR